jgi:hypothetical protein
MQTVCITPANAVKANHVLSEYGIANVGNNMFSDQIPTIGLTIINPNISISVIMVPIIVFAIVPPNLP